MKEIGWEEAHVLLAERYESQGELKRAAIEYQALARAVPYNASPYLRLGRLLLETGQTVEAEDAFRRALRIEEGYHAHHNLGLIQLKKERYKDAISELQSALRYASSIDDGSVTQTRYFLAVSQASQGEFAEAQNTVTSLLASHPELQPARELSARLGVPPDILSNVPAGVPPDILSNVPAGVPPEMLSSVPAGVPPDTLEFVPAAV